MAGRLSFVIFALGFLPTALLAQAVNDPTRPSYMEAPVTAGGAMPSNRLTSILHKKGMKPIAVIDGQVVAVGGKIGNGTLVKIRENSVLLQQDGVVEVLELTPGIEKTYNRPQTPGKSERPS